MTHLPMPKLTDLLPDKPLRAAEPRLYARLTDELARLGLHPYDVKAGAQLHERGVAVRVRYGERFERLDSRLIPWDWIEQNDEQIGVFLQETAMRVKRALIADYYKRGDGSGST